MSDIAIYSLFEAVGTVFWFLMYTLALSNGQSRRHRLSIGAGWFGVWMMGTAAVLYMSLEDWIMTHPAGDSNALSDTMSQHLFGTAYLTAGLGFVVMCLGIRAAARARHAFKAGKKKLARSAPIRREPDDWFAREPDPA